MYMYIYMYVYTYIYTYMYNTLSTASSNRTSSDVLRHVVSVCIHVMYTASTYIYTVLILELLYHICTFMHVSTYAHTLTHKLFNNICIYIYYTAYQRCMHILACINKLRQHTHTHARTHERIHIHVYICMYIYVCIM